MENHPDPRSPRAGVPSSTPSWECSLLGTSSGSSDPGRHEARGEGSVKLHSGRSPEIQALGCIHSTLIHSPGSWLSLRLWLQGMKRCCHFVDISCNYNLPTGAAWHLQFKRPVGQWMTAALRKGPATGIAEMIPNTTDFQEANFRGQFSSYPLRKEKKRREKKEHKWPQDKM